MKPDLTIIIPCYNCSKTLEQAVNSCYTQGLKEAGFTFEIVMVDDGSTDTTKVVMERLAQESLTKSDAKISIFFHEQNKGGGATRNTAVMHAKADIIFCLDSDDMLGTKALSKMLTFMLEKRNNGKACDGVGIHRSRKFKGNDVNNIEIVHTFGYVDQIIPVEALFQKEAYCSLYSTFMFTKKAFETTGGYPTNHGFDTQSFAWRFIMNELKAYTCPDAEYLHRINFNKSYYIREYESGKANYNWFLILSEFIYIFNDSVKDTILSFNIHGEKNLFTELCAQENILISDYEKYIKPGIIHELIEKIKKQSENSISKYDCYWFANNYAEKKLYNDALYYFSLAYKKGLRYPERFEKIMSSKVVNNAENINSENIVKNIVTPEGFVARGAASPIINRIIRKSIKTIKKSDSLYDFASRIYWFYLGIKNLATERTRKTLYRSKIEQIKKDKKIVVDLKFGGLGDCLVWSTLPRLLKETYNVDFYLSEQSLNIIRHKDIFKLCFEMNPYYKGTTDVGPYFSFDTFESEKSIYTFLTNKEGRSVIEILEKQFNLSGSGKPELYYKPNVLDSYKTTVFIDKNFITGRKLGSI